MKTPLSVAKKALLIAASLLVLFSLLALAPDPASGVPSSASGLAKAYQKDQTWLAGQQVNLTKAANFVADVQNLISEASDKGIDTAAITAALGVYQSQMVSANDCHTTAANVLTAHLGFDDSGVVTDIPAAMLTIHEAQQSMGDAHVILVQEANDLIAAIKAWAKANNLVTQIMVLQVSYANDQAWLTGQQDNLTKADSVVTNVQALISAATAAGLPVASLNTVLTTFQGKLALAVADHATADAALAAHDGFDDSGNVTDVTAAAATIKTASDALSAAHVLLANSSSALLTALNSWQKAHITTKSPVYPTWLTARDSARNLYNSVHVEGGTLVKTLDARLNDWLTVLLKELS